MTRSRRVALLGPLVVACAVYLFVPNTSLPQAVLYQVIVFGSLGVALAGVRHCRPVRARIWWAMLAGFALLAVGDFTWTYLDRVVGVEPFPSLADVAYLAGLAAIALGLSWLARGRQPGGDRAALIDAAVVAVGVGVLTAVFVITPLAADSSQSLLGRVVGSAYPVADLLLLGVLVRLLSAPGGRSTAYRLLVLSVLANLVADAGFTVITVTGGLTTPVWLDVLWLACRVLFAAACLHPSMRELSEPGPERQETLTRRRLVGLAAACSLAPSTLLLQAALGQPAATVVVALGSLTLTTLVLVRMSGLLNQVREQAVQLGALASLDGLTGLPNRRTWDHELSRACAAARDTDRPLAVAILDLDHFKAFNDTHGHQAGDLLLKEAAARWTPALRPGDLLARYGGEEFALLLPGCDVDEAAATLQRLQELTPLRQTFSAGVTTCSADSTGDPGRALARADEALYAAKRGGRARVQLWSGGATAAEAPQAPLAVDAARA